jgi:hypothetical protein
VRLCNKYAVCRRNITRKCGEFAALSPRHGDRSE